MVNISDTALPYGRGDATYIAAGKEEGIGKLVEYFYQIMDQEPFAAPLRQMHDQDLTLSKQKLAVFLSGWMGGPSLYREKFGPISIPGAHAHLNVNSSHGGQWLRCMKAALEKMDYPESLRSYLLKQFRFPVNMIVQRGQIAGQQQ